MRSGSHQRIPFGKKADAFRILEELNQKTFNIYNENVEVVLDEIWNSSEFSKDFFWKKADAFRILQECFNNSDSKNR